MTVSNLSVNRSDVTQKIDVESITGFDISNRPDLMIYLGQRVVDYVIDRTQNKSVDVYGKPLASYSKSYKDSDQFEAYGKSSKVDMSLTEGMLDSIDFRINGNEIELYFNDPDEADKAYGHITGMKGHKFLDGKTPKREFFGIDDDDFNEFVFSEVRPDVDNSGQEAELTALGSFLGANTDEEFIDLFTGIFDEEF